MERGIVRGRVASLLRSSEIKPYVLLICTFFYYQFLCPGPKDTIRRLALELGDSEKREGSLMIRD